MFNRAAAAYHGVSHQGQPMSQLFEPEYDAAPVLCFDCAALYQRTFGAAELACPECGFRIAEKRYREFYRHAFYAARYGVQYRSTIEWQDDENAPKFFLSPLGDFATLVCLAALSGVIGNAAWTATLTAIRKIRKQHNNCVEGGFELAEADVQKLIDYLSEYENGFKGLPDRIQHAILEEVLGDAAAENMVVADRLGKILFSGAPISEQSKRQAVVLYLELARRHQVRAQKRPGKPSWRFWRGIDG